MTLSKPVIVILILIPLVLATWWWASFDGQSEALRFGPPLQVGELNAMAPAARLRRVTQELERQVARANGRLDVLSSPARVLLLVRRSEPALAFTGFNVSPGQSPTLLFDLAIAYRQLQQPDLAAVVDAAIADASRHHPMLIQRWSAVWKADSSLQAQSAFLDRHQVEIITGSP